MDSNEQSRKTGIMVEVFQRSQIKHLVMRWRWTIYPTVFFLCSRIALLGFSQIAMIVSPGLKWETGSRDFLQQYPALDGLCRWDCLWFEQIARQGYWEAKATNFFPLYPLMARILHVVTGLELHLALLVISNLAGFGSLCVIYRLFTKLADQEAARWGLALFAAYPFAFSKESAIQNRS